MKLIPNLDPKKMSALMKQFGIKSIEVPAKRVVIEKQDGSNTIVENPSVIKIEVSGQQSFQVSGLVREESEKTGKQLSEEDVKLVMQQAKVTREKALKALEESKGDIAQAILSLESK